MTNGEKYKEQVLDITLEGDTTVAVCKGKPYPCKIVSCENCQFYESFGFGGCPSKLVRWLYEEYKEPTITLTEGQYHFFKSITKGSKVKLSNGKLELNTPYYVEYFDVGILRDFFSGLPELEPDKYYFVSDILQWEVEK